MDFTLTGPSTNCIDLFAHSSEERAREPALWTPSEGVVSFASLSKIASSAQQLSLQKGLEPGDCVLLFDKLTPQLYGAIIGLLALGITIVFVEPWMPFPQLQRVIQEVKPKAFFTGLLGMLWGARSKSIREIPNWIWLRRALAGQTPSTLIVHPVAPEQRAIITFTTGTTGNPKGVVRHHRGLICQHHTLEGLLQADRYRGADLCLFGNFALSNLASGRLSLIVPSTWSSRFFKRVNALPKLLQPSTLTCGPAFLKELIRHPIDSLEAFHIGGALSDCSLLEQGFQRWKKAHWLHVYGSSEAEPVASIDARRAVESSRERGFFQTLCLGQAAPEIQVKIEGDQTWVQGPYVCPYYLSNEKANRENKRLDQGSLWHRMGDRLSCDNSQVYWYEGRSELARDQFLLEQQLMEMLQTSALMLYREKPNDGYHLLGEGLKSRRQEILKKVPEVTQVSEVAIKRDRRHRARIDRVATLQAAGLQAAGLQAAGINPHLDNKPLDPSI